MVWQAMPWKLVAITWLFSAIMMEDGDHHWVTICHHDGHIPPFTLL